MFSDKIILDFEVEKGDPIDRCYFSTRIKLTDESKNFLCEKLGKPNNLDDYFDLNSENFYIYYNKYGGHYGINELYVRDNNGRYLATKLPLDHNGFSIELSFDEVNCGFYPLYAIYNPNQYDKEQEKSFEDNGELRPLALSVLDHFLNGLTIQDMFLQIQNKFIEKETKLAKEKRQAEKELNQKNEKLRELIENGEIEIFKVIKGNGIGNGRSAAILQLDGDLDASKYYIAEYEGNEYLHCMSHDYDILLDQSDLFFVLNSSSYLELESGFYSISAGSCAKYLDIKNRLFSDDQLSKQLCKIRQGLVNTFCSRLIYSENF
ncbi:hypothetical protein Wcon_00009 [Wolbachia endosymbiont of Cylisticus convexus]|uniref:hypothetical protein n=1 Tax=Wolbachia endosymbiont of Cylisticus convexus TaxID=118728 RepID=UPI000DF68510|nr:hypothetical protein [Wolbachia endosymbiont of Cylisticus convexus]RDD35714.1 hypothetical protein Wcon_00009 [Wolbachia endosymbiont of Cylisticus convexus]